MMNFIFYLIMIMISGIFYGMSILQSRPHKNILLENTLPNEALHSEELADFIKKHRQKNLFVALFSIIFYLPLLFISYDSLLILYFFVGMFAEIGVFYALQVISIGRLYHLKVAQNWQVPTAEKIIIDTKTIQQKNQKIISPWWFMLSLLLNIIASWLIYTIFKTGAAFWWTLIGSMALTFLFVGLYQIIKHLPVKANTKDASINQQFNDLFVHDWSLLTGVSSLVLAVIPFFIPLSLNAIPPFDTILFSVLIIAVIAYIGWTFWLLFNTRKKQDNLLAKSQIIYRDEDPFWRFGIYNNPADKRLNVPDRIGMNISVNFGRPFGKLIYSLLGVFLVALVVFVTVPMLKADFSDDAFVGEIQDQVVLLKAPLAADAHIKFSEIERVEEISELPKNRLRIAGTATNHYLTGKFQIAGSSAKLYIYQPSQPILKISTKNTIYYFASKNSADTKKLAEELTSQFTK